MDFSKTSSISSGEIASSINAMIDVLNLDIAKIDNVTSAEINRALVSMKNGYTSTFAQSEQWKGMIGIIKRMKLDNETLDKISNEADKYYARLRG